MNSGKLVEPVPEFGSSFPRSGVPRSRDSGSHWASIRQRRLRGNVQTRSGESSQGPRRGRVAVYGDRREFACRARDRGRRRGDRRLRARAWRRHDAASRRRLVQRCPDARAARAAAGVHRSAVDRPLRARSEQRARGVGREPRWDRGDRRPDDVRAGRARRIRRGELSLLHRGDLSGRAAARGGACVDAGAAGGAPCWRTRGRRRAAGECDRGARTRCGRRDAGPRRPELPCSTRSAHGPSTAIAFAISCAWLTSSRRARRISRTSTRTGRRTRPRGLCSRAVRRWCCSPTAARCDGPDRRRARRWSRRSMSR